MNRSMIKAAAAVCVLSLLTAAVPAGAAEWINLSFMGIRGGERLRQ